MRVNLATLPHDHRLRNTPMKEIGVRAKNIFTESTFERSIHKWKIASQTFNQLDPKLLEDTTFIAELSEAEAKALKGGC